MQRRQGLGMVALCVLWHGTLLFISASAWAQADQLPKAPAVKRELVASIVFDREPVERGLRFERGPAVGHATFDVDGRQEQGWRAMFNSAPGVGWGKSFHFTFTEPRFRFGRQPAVDIEIVFRSTAWAPVELWADTTDGSRRIASNWGNSPHWQTMRVTIDDAFFGGRKFNNPIEQMTSDGFDLRLNGFNDDLYIKSITVRGYDLEENPDYQRLLRLVEVQHPSEIFLFSPGQTQTLIWRLRNIARKAVDTQYEFELTDWSGQRIALHQGTLNIPGSSMGELPWSLETSALKFGVHRLHFRLSQAQGQQQGQPIVTREHYLGITPEGDPGRAKQGEFLYGLDVMLGEPQHYKRLLKWIDAMGVDIVRGGGIQWHNLEHVQRDLPIWEELGVQVLAMSDVPWHENEQTRMDWTRARAGELENVARTLGPRLTWWELGNEPDLTFFYPGPIEAYAKGFEMMSRAIRKGDPTDMPANGGLCFAGEDATRRAIRFFEVVDPETLPVIAYHGHGPGAAAERAALERTRAAAAKFGKADRPFIETESGVSAVTSAQEIVQARSVVQKMAYAQSERLPMLMWFRLLMFEEAYGNLRTDQEPRPAILAYRHMTQRLRGHGFHSRLDIGPEMEMYLFHHADGRRAIVTWSDKHGKSDIPVKLGGSAETLHEVMAYDLWGNRIPVEVSSMGQVTLSITQDPVYLTWSSTDENDVAQPGQRLLAGPTTVRVIRGAKTPVTVQLRNPTGEAMQATLTAESTLQGSAVSPAEQTVRLAAGEERSATVWVDAAEVAMELPWPTVWTTFLHVNHDVNPASFRDVPTSLPGVGGGGQENSVRGISAVLQNRRIDFEKLGGNMRERETALLFATVDSPREQTVRIGASADWWMQWAVNGQVVYDTLDRGNGGGYSITDHMFEMPLKQGRNLLVVKVQSGSQGWKLYMGSPGQVAQALNPTLIPQVNWVMQSDRLPPARHAVRVELGEPVAALPTSVSNPAELRAWQTLPVDFVLPETGLRNFYEKQPDSSRWWQGPDDLSAVGWVRQVGGMVHVVVQVRDDKHVGATSGEHHDRLLVTVTPSVMGAVKVQPTVEQALTGKRIDGNVTMYHLQLPVGDLGLSGDAVMQLRVQDTDDGQILKQELDLGIEGLRVVVLR